MVNMYSGSMMPMGYGMNGSQGSVNVHQNMMAKYGVGYEDFGDRPYAQPYPMAIRPTNPPHPIEDSWLARFIKKCFLE